MYGAHLRAHRSPGGSAARDGSGEMSSDADQVRPDGMERMPGRGQIGVRAHLPPGRQETTGRGGSSRSGGAAIEQSPRTAHPRLTAGSTSREPGKPSRNVEGPQTYVMDAGTQQPFARIRCPIATISSSPSVPLDRRGVGRRIGRRGLRRRGALSQGIGSRCGRIGLECINSCWCVQLTPRIRPTL